MDDRSHINPSIREDLKKLDPTLQRGILKVAGADLNNAIDGANRPPQAAWSALAAPARLFEALTPR
jgi:hypothetical protein